MSQQQALKNTEASKEPTTDKSSWICLKQLAFCVKRKKNP